MKLQRHLSLIILIAVNLLPIFGVIYAGWDIFEIVALYWFENVVIGLVNVLKIITCSPEAVLSDEDKKLPEYLQPQASAGALHHLTKLFFVPFFTLHYGMFCLVHGVFVFVLLGPNKATGGNGDPFVNIGNWFVSFSDTNIIWSVLAIIASHLYSYFHNYIGKNEFTKSTPAKLMHELHIVIILGAFAIQAIGSSVGMLILLIIGKIIIDAKLHLRSHRKLEGKS
jgi:Family of unknown function (DUF6498)